MRDFLAKIEFGKTRKSIGPIYNPSMFEAGRTLTIEAGVVFDPLKPGFRLAHHAYAEGKKILVRAQFQGAVVEGQFTVEDLMNFHPWTARESDKGLCITSLSLSARTADRRWQSPHEFLNNEPPEEDASSDGADL